MYIELYIVRHGKSTWDIESVSDIDRPLKERGIRDGYTMAQRLLVQDRIPDKIISSPAVRALNSATIFARTFNLPYNKIEINEEIYHAGANIMLSLIKQTADNIKSLMVFGHNPTFTDLANYFLNDKIENVPTTGIVGLKFKTNSWADIDKSKPKEWFFDFPKNTN
ncbi:histidine phosphatase family protein [Bacteroidota bacterium]